MAQFMLLEPNQVRGDQLIDEIRKATGIDLTNFYTFHPPSTLELLDALVEGREVEIQAIVDAHVPDPLYFYADVVLNREDQAEISAAAIPGWATWTHDEAAQWYQENVLALLAVIPDVDSLSKTAFNNNAQAIVAQMQDVIVAQTNVIARLAEMIIALRNKTWPNLDGSQ
jgi:hypothetical protein